VIFRSGLFSRRAGLTPAQFGEHWFRVHGALASHMPGVHEYLQNHLRERLFELAPFPDHAVDGISQQWFDDVAAMERCERSDEYAAVKRDIPNMQGAITILVLAGETIFGVPPRPPAGREPQGPAHKLVVLSRLRDAGVAATPGALAKALPRIAGGPLAYVQNVVVDRAHAVAAQVPSGKLPADAMAELFFEDPRQLREWWHGPAAQEFVHRHPLCEPLAAYAVEQVKIA
jgi:uncharacterized protein (TIGR02118 family)